MLSDGNLNATSIQFGFIEFTKCPFCVRRMNEFDKAKATRASALIINRKIDVLHFAALLKILSNGAGWSAEP